MVAWVDRGNWIRNIGMQVYEKYDCKTHGNNTWMIANLKHMIRKKWRNKKMNGSVKKNYGTLERHINGILIRLKKNVGIEWEMHKGNFLRS